MLTAVKEEPVRPSLRPNTGLSLPFQTKPFFLHLVTKGFSVTRMVSLSLKLHAKQFSSSETKSLLSSSQPLAALCYL